MSEMRGVVEICFSLFKRSYTML